MEVKKIDVSSIRFCRLCSHWHDRDGNTFGIRWPNTLRPEDVIAGPVGNGASFVVLPDEAALDRPDDWPWK